MKFFNLRNLIFYNIKRCKTILFKQLLIKKSLSYILQLYFKNIYLHATHKAINTNYFKKNKINSIINDHLDRGKHMG